MVLERRTPITMTTVSILCLQLVLLSAAVMTSTTTEIPTTTTEAPTTTTDAPTTSTEAPTMSTEAPTMSTEVLTTSTETLTIEDPTTTTETPTTTTTTAAPLPSGEFLFFIVELFCRGILVLKGEKGVPDLFLLHYYSSQSMQPSVK